ncbi:hypothetical protein KTF24_13835 [Burkholderia multivorans]|uniref:hypothetical protein n=1 Tax=Burkholderia multivorans TaxID=87883 RepID=UPI001C239E8B|nr:hypothetical protein [Burkholderia multivorans]MBU9668860.1 hypothetical protein [Burkholderia multivorans]HEF4757106.1 hypothetical protein [Burkholderia multivorans]
MANLQTNVPLIDVPPIDPKTGKWNEAWFIFLVQLFRRTGGTGGNDGQLTLDDVFSVEETFALPQTDQLNSMSEMMMGAPSSDSVIDMLFSPAANTDYAQAASVVTLGSSPATYMATSRQGFHITGGTVTALTLQRGPTVLPIGNSASDIVDKTFVSGTDFTPGSTTTLTLPSSFGLISRLWLFFDAAFQGDDQILSLVGTTLTLTSAIPVGVSRVYVKGLLQSAVGIGSTLIELNAGDKVNVTYSSLPTVTILPR